MEKLRILHYAKSFIESQIEVIEDKAEEASGDYKLGEAYILDETAKYLAQERDKLNELIDAEERANK
jgi:hypothetical protein|nr:MAG TPA: hypothetical protein [Caudoviricetes sp.]